MVKQPFFKIGMDGHTVTIPNGEMPSSRALGKKGYALFTAAAAGLDVAPGFIIPSRVTQSYFDNPDSFANMLKQTLEDAVTKLTQAQAKISVNQTVNPLLVVRTSGITNQLGLMEAIPFIGLDPFRVDEMRAELGLDTDQAYIAAMALVSRYGEWVKNIPGYIFDDAAEDPDSGEAFPLPIALNNMLDIYSAKVGKPFSGHWEKQLRFAIFSAAESWRSPQAKRYRTGPGFNTLPSEEQFPAIIVQAMLVGEGSETRYGSASTRDPETGKSALIGWCADQKTLPETLKPIMAGRPLRDGAKSLDTLQGSDSQLLTPLKALANGLEAALKGPQNFDFVVEQGTPYIVSCQAETLAINVMLKTACDLVAKGAITKREAIANIDPFAVESLLHYRIDPSTKREIVAQGLAASPGAAGGEIVFSTRDAIARTEAGARVILVQNETSPEDVKGISIANGVVTARGGLTSHAAVVARGMGRPCVTGAMALRINTADQTLMTPNGVFTSGDFITIDGSTGAVLKGDLPTVAPELSEEFGQVLGWADEVRRLGVRANADSAAEAQIAINFGAEGIGLCRTEHMFFDEERVPVMRQMILSENDETRHEALEKLLPMQRQDFAALFKMMSGKPVTIRLLDPPLHEFLPRRDSEFVDAARGLGISVDALRNRVDNMREVNPMLGHRGCRLAISHPQILEMQVRALFEALVDAETELGMPIEPEIMIPFVSAAEEVSILHARIDKIALRVGMETGTRPRYHIGTMIELPRAALRADRIALESDFFSFGTNDLTQTTFGISRDDASPFLALYREQGVFADDPFQTFDILGAGEMMRIAVEKGRSSNPKLGLGVCGEHGGEPISIGFFNSLGIDYVSCSPYRVPIARLAAAQATIKEEESMA